MQARGCASVRGLGSPFYLRCKSVISTCLTTPKLGYFCARVDLTRLTPDRQFVFWSRWRQQSCDTRAHIAKLIVGYGRVSTQEQDLTLQREEFVGAGCSSVYAEKSAPDGPSSGPISSLWLTAFGLWMWFSTHGQTGWLGTPPVYSRSWVVSEPPYALSSPGSASFHRPRNLLSSAVASDCGKTWDKIRNIEKREGHIRGCPAR